VFLLFRTVSFKQHDRRAKREPRILCQACRKKYHINKEEGYLLSPKTSNMSEHINDLIEAGIDSFKIEGE